MALDPAALAGFSIAMELLSLIRLVNSRLSGVGECYAVGGSVRDFLLGEEVADFDFALSCTPEQFLSRFPEADASFAKYGSFGLNVSNRRLDLTCFRKESSYLDSRHPSELCFRVSMMEDSKRRDFTVNALYMDERGDVYDFHGGLFDLKKRVLRFIGDPSQRIKEDPLRILRAERFARRLGFGLESQTERKIDELRPLLRRLNPNKVEMERRKG